MTLLAVAGMLDQTGKKCIRVSGEYRDLKLQQKVDAFIRGISVTEGIRRSSYGMIGGRSIGIGTTAVSYTHLLYRKVTERELGHVC